MADKAAGNQNSKDDQAFVLLKQIGDKYGRKIPVGEFFKITDDYGADAPALKAMLSREGYSIEEDQESPDMADLFETMDGAMPDDEDIFRGISEEALTDPVTQYMNEINKIPLLTPDEEKELGEKLLKGDGDAKERMINANLRLVINVAKRYYGCGVPFLDLIQEGNMGLMKAVDKYDVSLGYRFSTYAIWWIRQTITRGIADSAKTIRIPVHMHERIRVYWKARRMAETELGREPSLEELSDRMGQPVKYIVKLQKYLDDPVSLEMPVGDEKDSELGDFLESETFKNPEIEIEHKLLRESLDKIMSASLTEKERAVIVLRFGLNDGRARTLEEVGAEFHVTRERIRQIEAKALKKMGQPRKREMLRDFL